MKIEMEFGTFITKAIKSYRIMLAFVLTFAILSFSLSYIPKELFTSKALLTTNNKNQTQMMNGVFGGFLDSYNQESSLDEYALEVIKSREFFIYFINSDDEIRNYFINLGDPIFSRSFSGSDGEINESMYQIYRNVLLDTYIQSNGFISISFSFSNPEESQYLLEKIIQKFNEKERDKKISEFSESAERINEIIRTEVKLDSRELYSELFFNKLANILSEKADIDPMVSYVYKPIIPVDKSFPSRGTFLIIGTILGFVSSLFYIFFFRNRAD